MNQDYWQRQDITKPLYPDLVWSRPENKALSGKLLIMGGNVHGFAAAAEAYAAATKSGIGVARVLLPDSLEKTLGRFFETGEYMPSTPSGSFSRSALAPSLAGSLWADGVLLAGDFGRNSETAILLEQFVLKYKGQLVVTKDAVNYFNDLPKILLERPDTVLVLTMAQLQKLATAARYTKAFTFNMDFIRLVETLHTFSETYEASVIIKHLDTIFIADKGKVTTTKLSSNTPIWRVETAAKASVWWIQNPSQTLAALTTALVDQA